MPDPVRKARRRRPPTLALGLLGGALLAQGGRRGRAGTLLMVAGLGVIAHAARPLLSRWVVRRGTARRRIRLQTSIEVHRPVADVFAFCKDFENFPRVFGSLHSITDYQDGRSHWEVRSPSGNVLSWDAVVSKYVPNSVIGWSSVPGSVVQSSGVIRFAALEDGGTLLTIEITYSPRDTGLANAIRAFASQPGEDRLREDLEGAASYIEALPPTEPVVVVEAPA